MTDVDRVDLVITMHVSKVDYDHICDMVADLRDKGADVHVRIMQDLTRGPRAFPDPRRHGRHDFHT